MAKGAKIVPGSLTPRSVGKSFLVSAGILFGVVLLAWNFPKVAEVFS